MLTPCLDWSLKTPLATISTALSIPMKETTRKQLVSVSNPAYDQKSVIYTNFNDNPYFISAVFLYSCPGFKSSIKERMLYSSCKEPLVAAIEQELSTPITKKVRIINVLALNVFIYKFEIALSD